jgi:hypothetical protein
MTNNVGLAFNVGDTIPWYMTSIEQEIYLGKERIDTVSEML